MEENRKKKSKIGYFSYLILAYVFMTGFFICAKTTTSDIWYDEVFSVKFAQYSLADMFRMAARDVHPPLYYMYLKGCMSVFGLFGASQIQACKIASFLPFIAILVFAFTWVRKRFDLHTAVLYSVLMAMMPQMATYYVEIRMYSLALMFVTFAYGAMTDILNKEDESMRRYAVFFSMSLAAAYTQYFACVGIIAVYIILFVGMILNKRPVKPVLIMIGLSILTYIPWLPSMYRQMSSVTGSFWIQPMTLRSIPGCLKFIFLPDIANVKFGYFVAGVMILMCAASYVTFLIKKPDKTEVLTVFCGPIALALIVAVGFVFSIMGSPIFTYRYMIPMFGILYLNIAQTLVYKKKDSIVYAVMLICVMAGYISFGGFTAEENKKSEAWVNAKEVLSNIEEGSNVITNFDHVTTIAAFYLPKDHIYIYEGEVFDVVKDMFGGCDPVDDQEVKALVSSGKKTYFFGSFNVRDEIVENWEDMGISCEYTGECLVERYWFNIYELSIKED